MVFVLKTFYNSIYSIRVVEFCDTMASYMDQLLQNTPSSHIPSVSDFERVHRRQLSEALNDLKLLDSRCESSDVPKECIHGPSPINDLLSVLPYSIDFAECRGRLEEIVETTVELEARLNAALIKKDVLDQLKHQSFSFSISDVTDGS